MFKILHKVFTNQNGGDLLVDLLNQPYNLFFYSITSFFTAIFFLFSSQYKFAQQIVLFKTNFFTDTFQAINFYHHSPKEWVSVPMPPFLK